MVEIYLTTRQHKTERRHQKMKNRVSLEHYYLPGDWEQKIEAFVDYCNSQRYHESDDNVTAIDVYLSRAEAIVTERVNFKKLTIKKTTCSARKLPPNINLRTN